MLSWFQDDCYVRCMIRYRHIQSRKIHISFLPLGACIGFIVGALLSIVLAWILSWRWLILAGLSLVLAIVLKSYGRILFAILAGLLFGAVRVSWQNSDLRIVQAYYNRSIIISGIVTNSPENKEKDLRFAIETISFNYSTNTVKSQVYVMLPTGADYNFTRSDRVVLKGILKEGFGAYAGFLYRPQLLSIHKPDPPDFAWSVREWLSARVANSINTDEAGLGLGYLFGDKALFSNDLDAQIKTVGLSHLVVTSGFHLGIIVAGARKIFGKISRFMSLAGSIAFMLVFIAITGFSASMARAGLVSMMSLLAWYVGRKFHPARLIIYAATITIAIRPDYLTNIGFLLSFAVYAGILFVIPLLDDYFYGPYPVARFAAAIFPSLAAQLFCLPLNAFFFGHISLIGVLAGIILSPTIPLAMLATIFAPVVPTFAHLILSAHLYVINYFASIPWGAIEIDANNPQIFWLYIPIALTVGYLYIHTRHRYRPCLSLDKSPDYGKIYTC